MSLPDWDERHRTEAERPPDPLLIATAANLPPGRALDLACGTGRIAIWLAEHGWSVTAVDGSPTALEILAGRSNKVHAIRADLENNEYSIEPSAWDLIVVSLYLQRSLFEPLKAGLVQGGVALMIVLLQQPGEPERRFRARPGELAGYFEGWTILHSQENATVAEIVACKP